MPEVNGKSEHIMIETLPLFFDRGQSQIWQIVHKDVPRKQIRNAPIAITAAELRKAA